MTQTKREELEKSLCTRIAACVTQHLSEAALPAASRRVVQCRSRSGVERGGHLRDLAPTGRPPIEGRAVIPGGRERIRRGGRRNAAPVDLAPANPRDWLLSRAVADAKRSPHVSRHRRSGCRPNPHAFAVARRRIHTRTQLRCTECCDRQKDILLDRTSERREWPDFSRERGCSI